MPPLDRRKKKHRATILAVWKSSLKLVPGERRVREVARTRGQLRQDGSGRDPGGGRRVRNFRGSDRIRREESGEKSGARPGLIIITCRKQHAEFLYRKADLTGKTSMLLFRAVLD